LSQQGYLMVIKGYVDESMCSGATWRTVYVSWVYWFSQARDGTAARLFTLITRWRTTWR